MRKCGDIEDRLTAYLDGYLETAERQTVEEHLSTCPDCLHKIEELKRTRAILADLDEVDPPPGLTEKIMSRIHEEEERKAGFFRRLFFPLHVKIPVQALATVFVVVLAVYVFRSTLHETTNLERPSAPPPAVETAPHAVKKEATAEGRPGSVSPKPAPPPAQALKKEAAAPPAPAQAPDIAAQASPPARAYKAAPHPPAAAEKASIPERHTDDYLSYSKVPPPPEAGRVKTRGTAAMEEKGKAAGSAPMAPARAAVPDVRSRVTMMSKDPRQTAIQAKTIMRSLGATRIEESAADNVATVSGWIDTTALKELMARLKEIALVDEPNSSLLSGPKSSFVEITIRRYGNGDAVKPVDR
jgi:pyruvate/2-oxoglutarate dehydrogenase complex dihydrolipoamide acyltransferase (E2) component